jgi:hypothetical protein
VDASSDATLASGDGGDDGSNIFDSPLPDSASSPIEAFEIIFDDAIKQPLSCPTSHWEFPVPSNGLETDGTLPPGAVVTLRNTGSMPLAYIGESQYWIGGVQYTPGVPTSTPGEEVGVLTPGAVVPLTHLGSLIALVGSAKPFSVYDGGFAAADETTAPWPLGVAGSEGSSTMYIAEITAQAVCSPVSHP